jgi:hypothetical protein
VDCGIRVFRRCLVDFTNFNYLEFAAAGTLGGWLTLIPANFGFDEAIGACGAVRRPELF